MSEAWTRANRARRAGDLDAAATAYQEALPHEPVMGRLHLAFVLSVLGRPEEAEPHIREALRIDPEHRIAQLQLAHLLLGLGQYREGWEAYEIRKALGRAKRLKFPEWRGEPLAGKTLVIWPEQGLGDQIQCARFYPDLARKAERLVVVAPPSLTRIFEGMGLEVVVLSDATALPRLDFYTHPFSLPGSLGLTPQTIPSAPYISASPRPNSGRIGVVTRGRPTHINDAHRSLRGDHEARLLALPSAVNLDPVETGARDFQDTAEIVAGLDLVISVDTSVAHLAGAMGKPVWILLSSMVPEWRWGWSGASSPWYPTAKLFRQRRRGDWDTVISEIESSLVIGG